jgi:hypothetical protein
VDSILFLGLVALTIVAAVLWARSEKLSMRLRIAEEDLRDLRLALARLRLASGAEQEPPHRAVVTAPPPDAASRPAPASSWVAPASVATTRPAAGTWAATPGATAWACGNCGREDNPPDARRCSNCGWPRQAVEAARPAAPAAAAVQLEPVAAQPARLAATVQTARPAPDRSASAPARRLDSTGSCSSATSRSASG